MFIRIPVVNLWRRPVRTMLTAAGVAIAVAGFVAMLGFSAGVSHAWVASFEAKGTHVLGVRKGAVEILSTSLDATVVEEVRLVPGVADVAAELLDLTPLDSGETVMLCGWQPGGFLWRALDLRNGRLPAPGEKDAVVAGRALADALESRVGDRIRIVDRDYRIVGIAEGSATILGSALIMPLAALQELLNRPGLVTVIDLRLKSPQNEGATQQVMATLHERFPGVTFTESDRLAEKNWVLNVLAAVATVTSGIGLVLGIVILLNTLLMSVTERTRELGILLALGWTQGRIVAMVLLEAIAVSLIGGVLGIVAGAVAVQWLAHSRILHGLVEPTVSVGVLVRTAIAVVVLGTLAAAYPAWRATAIPVSRALRYE